MAIGFRYVLKQIAELDPGGSTTLHEIASRLNMRDGQLKGMMDIMEHMGHLEAVCEQTPVACTGCSCCPMAQVCSGQGTVSHGTSYRLTEKGKRVCST
ncbi:MAG: FeoC-like transcriptional regulator [Methanosarcinaceae archaeon]|nr:FeoC-like transcriptional regulator [Methanosarcinaceae archaeon]